MMRPLSAMRAERRFIGMWSTRWVSTLPADRKRPLRCSRILLEVADLAQPRSASSFPACVIWSVSIQASNRLTGAKRGASKVNFGCPKGGARDGDPAPDAPGFWEISARASRRKRSTGSASWFQPGQNLQRDLASSRVC